MRGNLVLNKTAVIIPLALELSLLSRRPGVSLTAMSS